MGENEMFGRRQFLAGALGVAGAAALSSCGGGGSTKSPVGGTASQGAATTVRDAASLKAVKLGLLPITDVAPLFLARKRGTFAAHGLQIDPAFAAGGAAILPLVESGEDKVGYSNVVSLLLLQSKGRSFKILAGGGSTATGSAPDYSEMLVRPASPLRSLAELGGKKVAINTLKNALEIVTRNAVEKAGGDQKSIQFVEIPFPNQAAALEAGQIDACLCNEPFQTILLTTGKARSIGKPFVVSAPGETLAFYFVKADSATGDPKFVQSFRAAMAEANTYATNHVAEVRAVIPEYGKTTADIASKIVLPPFPATVKRASLQVYAQLMKKYGLIDKVPDVGALLP